ncbi:hypothetical protein WCE41_02705 [Luteimonas sp. MJ246]|uniref:hypothetical protein n=1 Tax=Luteimonas sp. MJ174 TaxID=3129237 RepID=UPI0031BB01BF
MSMEIVPVWKNVTPELSSELIAMWARNGALPDPTKAAERAQQAVAVGRDGEGQIWGVGTAVLGIVPSFGQPTYLYRQFFDVGARGLKQTMPFLNAIRDTLEAYNASLPKPESVGVMIELQNDDMAVRYQDMYEAGAKAHFIGWSPRGRQLRMMYFKDARIMLPFDAMPRKRPVAAS